MRILIIGSKGFIGSHAYQFFFSKGYDCYACDVVVDYTDANYFLLDATNSDFNELFESHAFDVCLNCSGAASVPDSLVHPIRDFTLNTYNVSKMLDAIRKHAPHCKFINLSSAAVYGNPITLPIVETDFCKPVSPYGMHKLYAEQICYEYYTFFGMQTCSLRIFSAYGQGLKKQLLWDIANKSAKTKNLVLFGTGKETRDFIYISDILQAVELIIHKGNYTASVYNIANGIEITIKEIATTLLQHLQYDGSLSFSGYERAGDPINWRAEISKIQSLGYIQKISIHEGVKQYIKWLKGEQ